MFGLRYAGGIVNQINLTQPLRVGAAAGGVFPWESPYTTEPIATLEHNGANLFHIEMSSSASTRILGARIADPTATSTRDIDPATLFNRSCTVVNLTADPGTAISASELDKAIAQADSMAGDALLLRTGWGDREDLEHCDERTITDAPHFDRDAIRRLGEIVREYKVDLVLSDIPYLHDLRASAVHDDWVSLVPWLRPPWPSSAAKTYMRHYTSKKCEQDWEPILEIVRDTWLVLGLRNCGKLGDGRATINVAPFQVENVGEVPCTVVASIHGK